MIRLMKGSVIFLAAILACLGSTGRAAVVDTTDDIDRGPCGSPCSLRSAIRWAAPGEVISFRIPPAQCRPTVCVIKPAADYSPLNQPGVFIDGATQPKKNPAGPDILVDGGAGGASTGFRIVTANIRIRGLIIDRFKGAGVKLESGASGAQIGSMSTGPVKDENFIGIDETGQLASPNGIGVSITGPESQGNTISGNVISGNVELGIYVKQSDGNNILNNRIGTNAPGDKKVPNGSGIKIDDPSTNNTIGPDNLVSGNTDKGVWILSSGNPVKGNAVGTDAAKNGPLSNHDGVWVEGNIASLDIGPDNVISGNDVDGIKVNGDAPTKVHIFNNKLGMNGAGKTPLPNDNGIELHDKTHVNTINDNCISGNRKNGVLLSGHFASGQNMITGNIIGPDCAKTCLADSNKTNGVHIDASYDNHVEKNTITGSGESGVLVEDTHDDFIEGNDIGVIGKAACPNTGPGVHVQNDPKQAKENVFNIKIAGNDISDNKDVGVLLDGNTAAHTVSRVWITGNSMDDNHLGIGIVGRANNGMLNHSPGSLRFSRSGRFFDLHGQTVPLATVEVFVSDLDPAGFDEGFHLLGAVKADRGGRFVFGSFSLLPGRRITATATDISHNTSVFSKGVVVP